MPKQPQFDDRASQTVTLEDGRVLGYAEYGPHDGRPVFHLHGLPGSRFEGKLFESAAYSHNARIITIDRPGIGLSSPQPGRTAIDHAADVQAVAEHLKLKTFALMGVSGGGPYGFACAYAIPPSQLTSVALVAGCATWKAETAKNMGSANSWMFWGLSVAPWAASLFVRYHFGQFLRSSNDDDTSLDQHMSTTTPTGNTEVSDKERDSLEDQEIQGILVAEIREHFRQGYGAYTEDGQIIVGELELDIPEDRCKQIALWYGKQDTNVPPEIGEDYLKRLKGKARLRIEDETHLSIIKNWTGEILADLVKDQPQ